MLKQDKWLIYCIDAIKAIEKGAQTIQDISSIAGIPSSFAAKVVGFLRMRQIVDGTSGSIRLTKQPNNIMVVDLCKSIPQNPDIIQKLILKSFSIPITQL